MLYFPDNVRLDSCLISATVESSRMLRDDTDRLETLLTPVPVGPPHGSDLRGDLGQQSLYFRVKDARTAARASERAAEAAGESIAVPAEWRTVLAHGQTALAQHSKDIEIAAWMIEALVRLEGFAGLAFGFGLAQGLIERYWPDLHSVDGEDVATKISP